MRYGPLVLILAALAGPLFLSPARGADAPKCPCGPACQCPPGVCPACPVKNPTDEQWYAVAFAAVTRGDPAVLTVGVPGPTGGYLNVYEFPHGLKGMSDGVYDCFRGPDGRPVMARRANCPTLAGGCVNGRCPAAPAVYSYPFLGSGCPVGRCPR